MRFAIGIPQFFDDGEFDPAPFRAYLGRAEELGYESAWAMEQVLGSWPQFSPLETMSYAAACTSRLRLGCAVFVSTLHSPVHLAKAIASLDQLSGGRVEVGVSTGGRRRPFAAFGMSPDRYITRFSEGIELMRALWTSPSVTFDGAFWQVESVSISPRPRQRPYPPLWFGASGPLALKRAVQLGDGFFGAGSVPTATFAAQVADLRTELAAAGRADFPIAKRVYIGLDSDADRMNDALARVYGGRVPSIEAAAVTGPVAGCIRQLRAVAEAGAELILFTPLYDQAEHLERLAAEVIPHISS